MDERMTRTTRRKDLREVQQPFSVASVDVMAVRCHPGATRRKDFAVRATLQKFLLQHGIDLEFTGSFPADLTDG